MESTVVKERESPREIATVALPNMLRHMSTGEAPGAGRPLPLGTPVRRQEGRELVVRSSVGHCRSSRTLRRACTDTKPEQGLIMRGSTSETGPALGVQVAATRTRTGCDRDPGRAHCRPTGIRTAKLSRRRSGSGVGEHVVASAKPIASICPLSMLYGQTEGCFVRSDPAGCRDLGLLFVLVEHAHPAVRRELGRTHADPARGRSGPP